MQNFRLEPDEAWPEFGGGVRNAFRALRFSRLVHAGGEAAT